ncbi:MAG: hypothetical protein EBV72_11945 [Betaproteobacteria bacterium]|nr:hypothetical protein [Betaproteobacteria bacterium]
MKENDWNYGFVVQPLAVKYQDTFQNDLSVKGKPFRSGDGATLNYQFPTIRLSANKPIYQGDDGSYIRAGGSAVVRYAKVALNGSGQSFSDTNLIAIPLINIEASRPLGNGYSFFSRSDSPTNDLDVGVRLFFGGYDPKKADDYANRIFFNSLVVRYSF